MSLITAGIGPLCQKLLPGVVECYIAPREFANTFNIDPAPLIPIEDQDSLVFNITDNGANVSWYQWHVDERQTRMAEEQVETDNGLLYEQRIELVIPGLSAYKRAVIKQLFTTPVVVIMLLKSGKGMVAGKAFGLLPEYEATTGTRTSAQFYRVTLTGFDTEPFREISSEFLTNVIPPGPIP